MGRIRQSWLESGGVYGYRKVCDDMRDLGEGCGANRVARLGVNSSSVQMTRLGHKGYPLVLFCRNLTEARAAMCAELFSMFR